ncbi:MAG: membrane dipeptidase [Candidatus Lindowbacteria bacterium]|nr:membrane dipeptidase [Candidatus Lindowbacteria bacterium]
MRSELLIIDTLSHGPFIWSDPLVSECDRMLASGLNPFRIVQELNTQMSDMLVEDESYFRQYMQAWEECGVSCVSWTVGVIHEQPYSLEAAYHNYANMSHMLDNRRDFLTKVLKTADIERAHREGKKGVILNFQNLDHIGTDLDLLDRFYHMGIRIMQLTYNTRNAIGCGCTEETDSGLTDFGLAAVERLNQLGALIDVSHCGQRTSIDAARQSKMPITCTHTLAKKIYDHDRGKSDEVMKAVAERGGYIGILAVPGFLTARAKTTIDDMLDHLDYVVGLVGLEHVGLGTDFFGYSLPTTLSAKIDELLGLLGFRPEHRASV